MIYDGQRLNLSSCFNNDTIYTYTVHSYTNTNHSKIFYVQILFRLIFSFIFGLETGSTSRIHWPKYIAIRSPLFLYPPEQREQVKMGRKKAWIDKANAKSFYLVHRSVADDLNGESDGDEEGTGVKLAPAAPSLNKEGGRDAGDNGSVASSSASGMMGRNLVTPMGFKNDGYDYDQHLRPMGGGVFVGRDGKTSNLGFNSDDNEEEDTLMKEMVAADAAGMTSYTTTLPDDVMDEDAAMEADDPSDNTAATAAKPASIWAGMASFASIIRAV